MPKDDNEVDQTIKQTLSDINSLKDKILCKNPIKDQQQINAFKLLIVDIYNNFIKFNQTHFEKVNKTLKAKLKSTFIGLRDICIKYCTALGLNANFPDHIKITIDPDSILEFTLAENAQNQSTMPNIESFYTLCAKQITKNYDGSFGTLKSFINAINLLKSLAGSDAEKKTALLTFILTKLDQKALEKIPDDVEDIDIIIQCLKDKIKPDTAKVVEGRMIALTADNKPILEFQKEAEELAEQYQRSLVVEGTPLKVAEKQAIEKTVELCRKNSRSIEVRAVLNAAHFSSPSEVIAKMATTIDTVKNESAQNRFKKNDKTKNKNTFQNRNGNQNNYGGNYQNNRNFNSRNGNFNRGQNRQQGFNNQNNYNNNNYGNGRQSGNSRPNNGQGQGNNRNGHRPNPNPHNFYSMSGNAGFPLPLGGQQQQQSHQTNHNQQQ